MSTLLTTAICILVFFWCITDDVGEFIGLVFMAILCSLFYDPTCLGDLAFEITQIFLSWTA